MSRKTFMKELAFLLQDISEEERAEALEYYHNYFDEAGKENEDKVLKELGDPSRIAAMIKDSLNGQFEQHIDMGNDGISHDAYEKNYEVIDADPITDKKNAFKEKWKELDKRDRMILMIMLIVAIIPMTFPFIGVSMGIFGIFFTIVFAIFGVFFGLWIGAIALFIIAIVSIVIGVLHLWSLPAAGLIFIGIGCCILPFGTLFASAGTGIIKSIPAFIKSVSQMIQNLVNKGGQSHENI